MQENVLVIEEWFKKVQFTVPTAKFPTSKRSWEQMFSVSVYSNVAWGEITNPRDFARDEMLNLVEWVNSCYMLSLSLLVYVVIYLVSDLSGQ